MEKRFSTNVLKVDQDGELKLEVYEENLRTDAPFSGVDSKAVLAGGFPSTFTESPLPLSPTLQLNSDLTVLSTKELQRIAEAELLRIQAIDYASYQVDVNPRVCVIAADASLMNKFIDTYGGVLEIEPLLSKTDGNEYQHGLEMRVEKSGGGYRISYSKHSPVDFNKCSYCGECGQACPEKCISPDLTIDREKCSLCRECEQVCSQKAIDIHCVTEMSMHMPAIVLLGDVQLELPQERDMIFSGGNVDEYFKTLYSCEIKEVVCHNNSICQYSGVRNMGCGRCIASCSHGALSRSENGIVIDHVACEACGNCISVCPTGAMQNGYFKDDDFLKFIGTVKRDKPNTLILAEEDELHKIWWYSGRKIYDDCLFLEYSNIQALSYYHFLLLFVGGSSRTLIISDGGINDSFSREIVKANTVSQSLFNCDCVEYISTAGFLEVDPDLRPHPLASFVADFSYMNRRKGMSQLLQLLLTSTHKGVDVSAHDFDFFELSCDSQACTHCFACLGECKTLALHTDEQNMALRFTPGLCVGCGVCAGVCPEKVLELQKTEVVDAGYFKARQLAMSEPAACKGCGEVFGSRKSLDRVMQILAARESVNTDHFEYCGKCRVVNLFEAEKV